MDLAEHIIRNPHLYSQEDQLAACDAVRRVEELDRSDRDPVITATTYGLLAIGVVATWFLLIPLIAMLIQWGGQIVRGML